MVLECYADARRKAKLSAMTGAKFRECKGIVTGRKSRNRSWVVINGLNTTDVHQPTL